MKVLVAEDRPTVRTKVIRLLRKAGFETEGTGDSAEVVEVQLRSPVDIILMDMLWDHEDLPPDNPDGLEISQQIRKLDPYVYIMAVTAYKEEYENDDTEGVVDRWFEKPLWPSPRTEEFLTAVRESAAEVQDRYISVWLSAVESLQGNQVEDQLITGLADLQALLRRQPASGSSMQQEIVELAKLRVLSNMARAFQGSKETYTKLLKTFARAIPKQRSLLRSLDAQSIGRVIQEYSDDLKELRRMRDGEGIE